MYSFNTLTDETINDRLVEILDPILSVDASYQTLKDRCDAALDVVETLELPLNQWRVVDDYADAITDSLTVYAMAAYRLGFQDGLNSAVLKSSYKKAAEKILDALENGTVPISWHALNRPKLIDEIAVVLADIEKGR